MILSLEISKIESGLYRAAALIGGVEVTEPGVYSSIEAAIREEAAAVPTGFAHFAEVTYGGASSGTISLDGLAARASQVADQIVAVVAEMHRVSEP
jgi:hypothetical protein